MEQPKRELPSMPEVGRPESYYAKQAHDAERHGDPHSREAAKVGQYVTLALDPHRAWPEKLRYFQHALRRHCAVPPLADDEIRRFYRGMARLARRYCGEEALRLASVEDDRYANWKQMGGSNDMIRIHAIEFFTNLVGLDDDCPAHFNEEDWDSLRLLRSQWVPTETPASGDGGEQGVEEGSP